MNDHFFETFVLRTASVAVSDFELSNRNFIRKHKKLFDEAIYLSSPGLYKRYQSYLNKELNAKDQKAFEITIRKFISRMCYRTVPFKRFSAIGTGEWGAKNCIENIGYQAYNTIDYIAYNHILHALLRKPEIARSIKYYSNRSLCQDKENMFYIKEQLLRYSLEGARRDELLDLIIDFAQKGICFSDIIQKLKTFGIDESDAVLYTNELIHESILVAGWKAIAQGKNRWDHLIDCLHEMQQENPLTTTKELLDFLELLNNSFFSKQDLSVNDYKEVFKSLQKWFPEVQENYLFDSLNELKENQFSLQKSTQNRLLKAAHLLHKLFPEKVNPDLLQFKHDFYKRYGNASVSLLEVFHPESGLNYAGIQKFRSELLSGITFPVAKKNPSFDFSPAQQILSQKLHDAQKNGASKIILSDQDFNDIPVPREEVVNPTATISFRIAAKGKKIILDHYNRSTASKMIGKHGYQSSQITALIREIHQYENDKLKNTIIPVEICFLPNQKAGSICNYPHYRAKQISLRAKHSDSTKDIPLDDLYIRLEQGRMQVFSKKLAKEIRPFFSTPYLSYLNSFPLFRFLAVMSHDNHSRFSWGRIPTAEAHDFLARVEYKDVILKEAQWKISYAAYKEFLVEKNFNSEALKLFIEKRNLSKYTVVITDGDSLLINWLDPISVASIEKVLKKEKSIWCSEAFIAETDLICKGENFAHYHSDFYAFVKQEVHEATTVPLVDLSKDNRASEWLYFKIYLNPEEINSLLTEELDTLISDATPYIQKWFFIRYDDGKFHLRLRFHLKSIANRTILFELVDTLLRRLLDKNKIRSYQLDQYQPERDRYCIDGLEKAETIFYYDSVFTIKALKYLEHENMEDKDWLLAFLSANSWLDIYNNQKNKHPETIQPIKDSFDLEFKTDKHLRKTIKEQFNKHYKTLDLALNKTLFSKDFYELLQQRNKAISLLKPSGSLFDYMHMSANRIISSRHRKQELVIAHFLHQWHTIQKYKSTK